MSLEQEPALGAPWRRSMRGRVDERVLDSVALRGNPLGDPHVRPVLVYVPPGGDDRALPVIHLIQGFTGQVDMWRNRSALRPSAIELIDELFATPGVPPCLVVMSDCWTSLGGSQFVDSPATGRYHTYLCDEVVPFIDSNYRTLTGANHRAITGKSSGGYGAMITPMLRPDLFGAMATHAGDALFELCYWRDVPDCVRALRDHYDGSMEAFLADVRTRPLGTHRDDHVLINMYAMAACYSADEDGTVQLPFDAHTGRMRDDVWQRWLAWDPVRMAATHADALRSLSAVYIDAGTRDEFFLDMGAIAFRDALIDLGVEDVRFELFDGGHMSIEYRYPVALRHLAERIGA